MRCDADPHRLPVGHGDLDVDAPRRLHSVGHQRPHERRTQPTVDHRLQWCVDHRSSIQVDADRSDPGHVAAVAGEPDRINLAGSAILCDDTAGTTGSQTSTAAVLIAGGDVEIAAAAIEARHLKSLSFGAQIRQPIQSTVGVPAHHSFAETCDDRLGRRSARGSNTGDPQQQEGEYRRPRPNTHRHSHEGYCSRCRK